MKIWTKTYLEWLLIDTRLSNLACISSEQDFSFISDKHKLTDVYKKYVKKGCIHQGSLKIMLLSDPQYE